LPETGESHLYYCQGRIVFSTNNNLSVP
jgi:hypothetical protein